MICKRLFDIACSGIGMILLSPTYLVIAVAIRLDSSGPIFFRQTRIGRGGMPFRIHKFRTMSGARAANAPQITIGADPRITRIGGFLRKSKLDEIPQLIDVFIGKMSLVGPRPEVPSYLNHYTAEIVQKILSVRPGITDQASLIFINESELLASSDDPNNYYINEILPIKIEYHLSYIKNRSMMMDLMILAKTAYHVIRQLLK